MCVKGPYSSTSISSTTSVCKQTCSIYKRVYILEAVDGVQEAEQAHDVRSLRIEQDEEPIGSIESLV